MMTLMITVNVWFLVSLCLLSLVLGMLLRGRSGSHARSYREQDRWMR